MGSEWKQYRLSDVIDLIGGGTPKRSHPEYWGGEIPWLSVKDFNNDYRHVFEAEETITKEGLENSSTKLLRPGQLIISARGTVGALAQLVKPMAFNQSCYGITAKNHNVTNDFLYYLLKFTVANLRQITHGAVFDTITRETFNYVTVALPPLPEQRAIAHILGSLDDKIELNRQMNRTLEKMAQAIFKSWFIDFDPVRAKAEGRDPGLPKEIADLFPDSFEDSEIGLVPEGWQVESLGNLLELAYGKGLRAQDRRPGTVAVYGSNGQVGWHDEKLVKGPGIVVGRKGNPGIVTWVPTDFFPIDTTFYVVPKGNYRSLYFLFHVLRAHDLQALAADSAVPGLNRNLAYMSQQVVPPPSVLVVFDRFVTPLYDRMRVGIRQNYRLAGLRDTLLPNLLSGELEVPDAVKALEDAV